MTQRASPASLVDGMKDMARRWRGSSRTRSFSRCRADMLFINRLQFGFYSVLARMDVEVDYASVERESIPGA